MRNSCLALLLAAGPAFSQDADLTILVDGDLLQHGGVVEVTAVPSAAASPGPHAITLTERFVRVQMPFAQGASYNYRFRPVPAAMDRPGMDAFATEALSIEGRTVETPESPLDGDFRSIRVLPFDEYGGIDEATRTAAAWGEVTGFAALPPANHWGARALPWVFDTFGDRRTEGMICTEGQPVEVCTPDPDDALLVEALWWRSIAENRLDRLRHDALRTCYDGGGLFGRPDRCEGVAGRGWPTFEPAD